MKMKTVPSTKQISKVYNNFLTNKKSKLNHRDRIIKVATFPVKEQENLNRSSFSEGKARKKTKAKEEAAVQMIKQLIRRQKCNDLPMQIIPLTDYQISEMTTLLDNREDLIDKLEEKCLRSHEPPPLYTVLSETGKNNDPYFTMKCEAMGYTALGHGSQKLQAKRNSAKSILNLVSRRKKS